ncbi:hypothetical protein PR048_024503 [Dryococelus australis]|uniref:Uncharacterized protein n=1 Tax=Dryococelus australis TaxID=614101 RepID=A0ABQ9GNS2_9NEOP|nr:hypothetical protein PR048_024503 [Dryococelus australis]
MDSKRTTESDIFPVTVTVSTAERSLSAVRRLKSWIRQRMGQQRLSGLALLHVHQNIDIYPQQVLPENELVVWNLYFSKRIHRTLCSTSIANIFAQGT